MPRTGATDRQLPEAARPEPIRTTGRTGRRPAIRSAHHPSLRRSGGQASRRRSRPSPSAPPHPGHPDDQPRHEPRGHRCPARSPLHAHDTDLCTDLQPHRGRGVLPGHPSRSKPATRAAEPLPASLEGANMRRIAAEHRRLLGNGHCTRPIGLDCTFESVCERCGFFETGPQFLTILRRQRDDAAGHGQTTEWSSSTASSRRSTRPADCASMASAQGRRITHVIAPWGQCPNLARSSQTLTLPT